MAVGDHQRALRCALTAAGFEAARAPASVRLERLPGEARAQVMELYRTLGGIAQRPGFTPNSWDCPVAGGLVLELDELQHFNRYRAVTLGPAWAHELPWRATYLGFCAVHEHDCMRTKASGGFWSTPKSESLFGVPVAGPKTLDGVGSPRWKQRALYDAMRDIAALHGVVTLARVAIVDEVEGAPLGAVLAREAPLDVAALRELITARTTVAGAGRTV